MLASEVLVYGLRDGMFFVLFLLWKHHEIIDRGMRCSPPPPVKFDPKRL